MRERAASAVEISDVGHHCEEIARLMRDWEDQTLRMGLAPVADRR